VGSLGYERLEGKGETRDGCECSSRDDLCRVLNGFFMSDGRKTVAKFSFFFFLMKIIKKRWYERRH